MHIRPNPYITDEAAYEATRNPSPVIHYLPSIFGNRVDMAWTFMNNRNGLFDIQGKYFHQLMLANKY